MRNKIRSCLVSQKGLYHTRNEDRGYRDDQRNRYAVADGIGGLPGAHKASEVAIACFARETDKLIREKPWSADRLRRLFNDIHQAVIACGQDAPDLHGLGTTFSALISESEEQWWLLHAGDSRIYGLGSSGVDQMTTDQTLSTERQEMGLPAGGEGDATAHILTNYVGSPTFEPSVTAFNPRAYQSFVLCTDGLCKKLSGAIMEKELKNSTATERDCRTLAELALRAGSCDDITVIIVRNGAYAS